jgi:ParB-like chromosome segregation protein Spo0J
MQAKMEHHEYAGLFPLLSDSDLRVLADDIAANGLTSPIVRDEAGLILDGRNRERACVIAGIEPRYTTFRGTDDEKLAMVISANLHRRHLTTSQRASVAARLLPIYEAQAAKRKERKPKSVVVNLPQQKLDAGKARDKAGAALNVSGKSVDMASKVHRKAIPQIVSSVDMGELSVSAAAVVSDLPKAEQQEIAAGGVKSIKAAAAGFRHSSFAEDDEPQDPTDWLIMLQERVRNFCSKMPLGYRSHIVNEALSKLLQEDCSKW